MNRSEHPLEWIGSTRVWICPDETIYEHQCTNGLGAKLIHVREQLGYGQRPAHENRRRKTQLLYGFIEVSRPSLGEMALRDLLRPALGAWIDGNDPVALRELADLLLPPHPRGDRPEADQAFFGRPA
jgi:hypothetical protein